ncbi:MAG: hypothetical protein Q9159_007712 [Coniocarpon cinnabarinum]
MGKPTGDLALHPNTDRSMLRLKNGSTMKYYNDKPQTHFFGYFLSYPSKEELPPERHWTLFERMRELNPARRDHVFLGHSKELEYLCERLHDLYEDRGFDDRERAAAALWALYQTHPGRQVQAVDIMRATQKMYMKDQEFRNKAIDWLLYADGQCAKDHDGQFAVDERADDERRKSMPTTPSTSSDEAEKAN